MVDALAKRDKRWQMWVPMIGIFLSLPTQLAFLLWPVEHRLIIGGADLPFALVFMGLSAIFASFWIAPSYAAVQNLVPQYWRTQASAMMLLAINLAGGWAWDRCWLVSLVTYSSPQGMSRCDMAWRLWLVFLLSVPLPMRLVLSPMPMLLQRKRLRFVIWKCENNGGIAELPGE